MIFKLRLAREIAWRILGMLRSLNAHQCGRSGGSARGLRLVWSDGRGFPRRRQGWRWHKRFRQRLGGDRVLTRTLGAAGLQRAHIVVLRFAQFLSQASIKLI